MTAMVFIAACTAMAVACSGLGWAEFMLFRNRWVYRERMTLLERDIDDYDTFADYEEMMRRFWIWDVEKFRLGPKP